MDGEGATPSDDGTQQKLRGYPYFPPVKTGCGNGDGREAHRHGEVPDRTAPYIFGREVEIRWQSNRLRTVSLILDF